MDSKFIIKKAQPFYITTELLLILDIVIYPNKLQIFFSLVLKLTETIIANTYFDIQITWG